MQQQCPFSVLGLELSASKKEINAKWNTIVLAKESNSPSKMLSEARVKALEMHDTLFECKWARQKKRDHKKKVMELARDILDYEFNKLKSSRFNKAYLQEMLKKWTPLEQQEANAIVQNGISDSKKKLSDAEELIVKLKIETKDKQKIIDQRVEELRKTKQELADAHQHIAKLQKENNDKQQNVHDQEPPSTSEVPRIEGAGLGQGEGTKKRKHAKISTMQPQIQARTEGSGPEGAKKRKHGKVLKTSDEYDAFKQNISDFIQSKIQASQNPRFFTASRQIADAFVKNGFKIESSKLFEKEIRRQLTLKFPDATHTHNNSFCGYRGISLIE